MSIFILGDARSYGDRRRDGWHCLTYTDIVALG